MTSMPKITMEWQRFEEMSAHRLYELLRFRQSIFVVEQRSPYPDLDDLDQSAWHLLLRADGELAGYLRLVLVTGPPPAVRIGRVAVAPHLRGRRIGRALVEEALRFSGERYAAYCVGLGAQLRLVRFYESLGFEVVSDPYDDFGVPHVNMRRETLGAVCSADQ
jgi:ElaA protein